MDRSLSMLFLSCALVSLLLLILALFAQAPIFCSCICSLLYTIYLFLTNETHEVHHAQEYENRFWTIFAMVCSTALFFATDSPLALGIWNPSLGFISVLLSGYAMHIWDRHMHRQHLTTSMIYSTLRRKNNETQSSSWNSLTVMQQGMPLKDLLEKVNSLLRDIDQILIPSTVNNFINTRFIIEREREIISIFEEAEPRALNYLISHTKLGLLFYKIKDHRRFNQRHRTQLIELLASERISELTIHSRVIVLHALQMMKLPANAKAEHWVRKIILSTEQDELSDLKTQADGKGHWYCMSKLIYDDIRSDMVREDILRHIQKQSKVQNALAQFGTSRRSKSRQRMAWRKILSDVDDTLTCSGGSYPAGIDKRFGKKVVYPGVLAFYRELDLGANGPEEWHMNTVGNLVFLSARPHLYRDISEKHTFEKFKKLQERAGSDGRGGMHTVPSLLSGDLTSGKEFIMKNDYGPLAHKKFENFKKYVSIYPEFRHVFVCDNGQGDVCAAELMVDAFPKQIEAIYVHVVQKISNTYKYSEERWRNKPVKPFFFKTYPEAALDAIRRDPPLISPSGLRRLCQDAINDFYLIKSKDWPSQKHKWDRREELNQALWSCNNYLEKINEETVPLLEGERLWKFGERVSTPYGNGVIKSFDAVFETYYVELDWRPLSVQVTEYEKRETHDEEKEGVPIPNTPAPGLDARPPTLETVLETVEETDEEGVDSSCLNSKTNSGTPTSMNEQRIEKTHSDESTLDSLLSTESSLQETIISEELKNVKSSPNSLIPKLKDEPKSSNEYCLPTSKEDNYHPVYATIQGRLIKKFAPPSLPNIRTEDENLVGFSFWNPKTKNEVSKVKTKPPFCLGDKCSTPFGPGVVAHYREDDMIVVVDMSGWSARAYLHKDSIKLGGTGFFGSLLQLIGTADSEKSLPQKEKMKKEAEFPYVSGTILQTPFGEGKVFRPVDKKKAEQKAFAEGGMSNDAKSSDDTSNEMPSKTSFPFNETIGVSLTSWYLADGSNPKLYCTVSSSLEWKKFADDENKSKASGGIFTAFGSFVSQSVKLITGQPEQSDKKTTEVPTEILVPRFEQYYMDGAVVTTQFGEGTVCCFRASDGMYEVVLNDWKMMNGKSVKLFLMKGALNYHIRNGCHEGYPILTSLGLSGTLASVQPRTGIHIVTIPSAGMVCYLQPANVICPLKAAVGEDVLTPYGEGKVVKYRLEDDMYEISLPGAQLYAKAEAFDRVNDSIEDQDKFGMKWLLGYLFFGNERNMRDGGSQRSRSNSIASIGGRSQSSRSII